MTTCLKTTLILLFSFVSIYSYAQVDTEFWFAAPDVISEHGDIPIVIRVTALDKAATVTLSLPANSNFTTQTLSLAAGAQGTFEFNSDVASDADYVGLIENSPVNTVNKKGILITSTEDVTVYYDVTNDSNPDRFTLKGENALGTEFYVSSQDDYANVDYDSYKNDEPYEQVNIVATEDNTEVEITPTADVQGHAKGVTYTVELDRGESYCIKGNSLDQDYTLSGTHIVSDKEIAVTISDDSVNDGGTSGAWDLIGDQTIPVSICGTEYIAMYSGKGRENYTNKPTAKAYVMATEDNTTVLADFSDSDLDETYTLKKAGDACCLDIEDLSSIHITSTSPVYVYQLSGSLKETYSYNELGSGILPPIKCTGSSSVTFTRVLGYGFYVQVLTQYENIESFDFSGNTSDKTILDLSKGNWTRVPGTGAAGADTTWYFMNQYASELSTGTSYSLSNEKGLFHMSVFDYSEHGSASFGYFSSFNSLAIHGVTEACEGDAVTLSASESMESYSWYSEATKDEVLSDQQEYVVTETGRYWVTATTDDDACVLADTIDVDFEVPEFTVDYEDEICQSDTVIITPKFNEDSDENYTFEWSHGSNEDVSTDSIYAFITTVSDTTLDVYVTVFNEDSCSTTDTIIVTILPDPDIEFDIDITNASLCYGSVLSDTIEAKSYAWTKGSSSGEVIDTTSSITVYESGWYYLTVSNGSCSTTDSVDVSIIDLPEITLNDTTLCHEDTYTSPSLTDSYTYEWSTKYSKVSSSGSSITLSTTDSLYVTYTNKSTGCSNSDSAYIYFRDETKIDSANVSVCAYTNKTLTASSKIVGQYAWSYCVNSKDSDLNVSSNTLELINILPEKAGKYTVTGVDENGCDVSQDFILTVNLGTSFNLSDVEICEGESATLDVDGLVSANSFEWYNDNPAVYDTATVFSTSKKISIDTEGTYYVMAVQSGLENGCSSMDSVVITVDELPTITLDSISAQCQGTTYTYDAGSGFSSYKWQDNSTSQTYTAKKPQTVYVTVTDGNTCSNSDTTTFAWKAVHVIDDDTLVVCPQTKDYTIDLEDGLTNISWEFYDNYNNAVSNLGNNTTSTYKIDEVDTLDAGLYIINATEDGCPVIDSTELYVVATASINLGDDRTICEGETIQLNANKGFTSYEWYYNTTEYVTDSISVTAGSKSTTEKWTVYASYNYGECELESSVNVENVNLPTLTLQDYSQPCSSEDVYLIELITKSATNSNLDTDDPANTLTYYWNGDDESSSLEDLFISKSGTYTLSFSNKNLTTTGDTLACYSSDTTEVDYRDPLTMDLSDLLICPEETTTLDAPEEVTEVTEYDVKNYQWVYIGNPIDSCDANSSWEDVSTAGNYVLKVQYSDSLCFASDTMEVVTKESPSVTIYGDTVIFEGESTTLSTDYSYLSYLWSTGATVESIDVSDAGYYIVTVEGQNNCTNSDTTQVVVKDLPSFTEISLNDSVLCYDETYTTPDYGDSLEFSWSTKLSGITSNASSISLTQTDSLYVTITDLTTGYTKSDSAYIYFYPKTTVASTSITPCAYADYTFTASDLIKAPYVWSFEGKDLDNSTSSYTLNNILSSDSGTYTVTGLDENGCTVTQDFILEVIVGSAFDFGDDKEICEGDSIQLSAAVSADSYVWYFNQNPEVSSDGTAVSSTQKYFVSESGTYYAMAVSTSNGCSSVDSVQVTVHELPDVDLPDVSEQCQGTAYEYDAGDYSSYLWQDGSTNQTYTAIIPQTVSVKVTDENTCSNSDTTQYVWKDVNLFSVDTVVVCPESSYTIDLEEGLSNIVWYFNNGETTTHLDNDGKDSYTISSVDSINDVGDYIVYAQEGECDVYDTLSLFAVATSSINLGDDRTICEGETIQLNANQGFTSYEWYYNTTEYVSDEISVTAGSKSSTELWTVYASYNYGECTLQSSVNVINVNLPTMTLQDYSQPCSGDTVYLTELITKSATNSNLDTDDPANILTYYWNGADESSPLEDLFISEKGTYTLSFSNKNLTTTGDTLACYSSEETQVDYRDLFTMSDLSDKLICSGESTTLDAPKDVTSYSYLENYQWVYLDDDGNAVDSCDASSSWSDVSDAGDYVLKVQYTDSLCFDSDTLTIVTKETPDVNIYGDTIICEGDTTTLSTDYGYPSYKWSTGETTESVDVVDEGDYILTITGHNNCENSDTTTLVVNELPIVTLTDTKLGVCNSSSVELSVANVSYSDGTEVVDPEYEWSTWDTTSITTVSSEGEYTVTVTDNNGCSNEDSATVYSYPLTEIDLSGIDTIACSNEGILLECPLDESDISTYWWSKSGTLDTLAVDENWTAHESGTYILNVIDANLCEVIDSVSIVINASPSLDLGADTAVCISSSYEIDGPKGLASYLWSTGETTSSISISGVGQSDYWLSITDSLGCSVSDTVAIATNYSPTVTIPQPDTVCAGTEVQLVPEISGATSYSLWWNSNTSAQTIKVYSGTYWVTVTDDDTQCYNSDTVTVVNYDSPDVSLGDDQYICPVIDTCYVSPEEGDIYSAYLWHNEKTTYEIVGDIGSINSVTVTDENGCTAYDQVVLSYLVYSDTTFSYVMCQQDTTISLLDIDSDADNHTGEYYWYTDGSTEDYYTFSESDTARVSIGITIDDGESTCYYKQDTVIMDFYSLPVITTLDTTIYQQVVIEMDNENPPYTYSMDSISWQDDNTFDDLSGEGEYTVYVIDSNNCSTSETFTLSDDIEIDAPKFFTPNGDGYNDTWSIEGIERLPNSVIRIYDRYGKLIKIYKATDDGWDGTYQNRPMPVTDYWYVIELKPLNKLLKGHFTLKR